MNLKELKQLVTDLDTALVDENTEVVFNDVRTEKLCYLTNLKLTSITDVNNRSKTIKYLMFY